MDTEKKVIVITGGTDGIGKAGAIQLAKLGYSLAIHGRNDDRLRQTKAEIIEQTGNDRINLYLADLSDLGQVKRLADILKVDYPEIYCLINNAGTFQHQRNLNSDGLELTFVINHLAPFLLTNLLLDNLKAGSPARIINVSSVAHRNGIVDFENLQGEKTYTAYGAYALSKLANILFTYELSRKLIDTKVTTNCLHPGVIDTKLLKEGFGVKGAPLNEGCDNSVYLATSPDVENVTGKYFVKRSVASTIAQSNDEELCRKFWEHSEELVRSYLG